jgi:hypothetical protein
MTTPLTEAEHARLRYLMTTISTARLPIDDRLIDLGLAVNYTADCRAVAARDEVVGEDGTDPYYEKDGSVSEFRYPDAATFVPRVLG